MSRIAVMGFGNPCRMDDGVGIYVIEQLREQWNNIDGRVSFFDMGTSAFEVLFKLPGHNRIILIDAVINTQEPEGTLFVVPAQEVEEQIQSDPLVFLHGMKWNQALSYARKILNDKFPEDIQVYLIAVNQIGLGVGIGELVREAADRVVKLIMECLPDQTHKMQSKAEQKDKSK